MKQISKFSCLITAIMTLAAQPALAKICPLHQSEVEFPVTQSTTLGHYFLLGIMLTLIAVIFVVKWVYRKELDPPSKKSEDDSPAIQTLKQLKIGTRFSDWTHLNRLAGQKQPAP